jgi:hypothetical protein
MTLLTLLEASPGTHRVWSAVNCNRYVHTLFVFRWITIREHAVVLPQDFGYLQTGCPSEF